MALISANKLRIIMAETEVYRSFINRLNEDLTNAAMDGKDTLSLVIGMDDPMFTQVGDLDADLGAFGFKTYFDPNAVGKVLLMIKWGEEIW